MQWTDIRTRYRDQWLLIEAMRAHSEGDKRHIEDIAVINSYPDSDSALRAYADLHRDSPSRELYVFHTSRETLDVTERRWLGIRLAS
jgi:hypothetical protein